MWSSKKILGLFGLLLLTGCPYTQGCESADAASADGGGVTPTADGGPTSDATMESDAGDGGTPVSLGPILPNCMGLTAMCAGESCCAASNVPEGSFNRLNDPLLPAQVSAFRLDSYEVVVGRFRSFVNAGKGTRQSAPVEGTGANPKIPGTGWSSAFNMGLTETTDAFRDALKCDPTLYNAYSDTPGVNDTLPMNCVTWFEAQAFCIWDGGRLPTETEWNYAAAGGNEQRVTPWGGADIDKANASYGCQSGDSIAEMGAPLCTFKDYTAVGMRPTGKARWGHSDMAGNVWERVFDYFVDPFRLNPCNDCADAQENPAGHGIRGGSINWAPSFLRTDDRTAVNSETPDTRTNTVGFRCARPMVP